MRNRCAFCGAEELSGRRFISTRSTAICENCVRDAAETLDGERTAGAAQTPERAHPADAPVAGPPAFVPLSGRAMPRFAGISTFFRLPVWEEVRGADVAILGIPFDGGTTYRPGARFGPREIRSASCLGRGFQTGTGVDIFRGLKICDAGDVLAIPTDLPRTLRNVEARIGEIADRGAIPLSVGGDHTVTLPVLRALAKRHDRKLAILHFDAHLDTYPPAWDVDFHHGTTFRHVVEERLADPEKVIQVGIRGPLAGEDDLDFARRHGFEVITIDDVREMGARAIAQRVQRLRGSPVYVSFDIDGIDPGYAPGTGTPVPGGLTPYECQVILRGLAGLELVGFDVVEVSPHADPTGVTPLVAASMMQEWLGALASLPARRRPK